MLLDRLLRLPFLLELEPKFVCLVVLRINPWRWWKVLSIDGGPLLGVYTQKLPLQMHELRLNKRKAGEMDVEETSYLYLYLRS